MSRRFIRRSPPLGLLRRHHPPTRTFFAKRARSPARWETHMRVWIFAAASLLTALGGCNHGGTEQEQNGKAGQSGDSGRAASDPLAAHDDQKSPDQIPDAEPRPLMQAQVVLDRLGFTPGVVDGKEGLSTRNAVSGFQEANGLQGTR